MGIFYRILLVPHNIVMDFNNVVWRLAKHSRNIWWGTSESVRGISRQRYVELLGQLGPLHTRDWEHVMILLQAHSLVEKAELVQVCFTLRLRDQQSMWMQDGGKVYMDSYMASNGWCFTVTWTIFKNHPLEVGLTQKREIMALQRLPTVDLLYPITCEDPRQ